MGEQGSKRMQGHLLKRNQEYRKANLLGQKYNKRWVEVTQDTLVYAGSQQEVLTGKIQVFAMHEMAWVKKEAENKFTVRFLERALTFKLESGAAEERDAWVAALEAAAAAAQGKAAAQTTGTAQLERLKKVAEASLLQQEAEAQDTIAALRAPSQGNLVAGSGASGHGQQLLVARSGASLSKLVVPEVDVATGKAKGSMPLSPRSMLANTLAGTALLHRPGSSTAQQRMAAALAQAAEEGVAAANGHGSPNSGSQEVPRAGSAARRAGFLDSHTGARSSQGGESSGATTPEQPCSGRSSMDFGSAGGAAECMTPGRRKHILRQKTPGYLLVHTEPPASSSSSSSSSSAGVHHANGAPGSHGSSNLQRRSLPCDAGADADDILQLDSGDEGQQVPKQHAQVSSRKQPPVADDSEDEQEEVEAAVGGRAGRIRWGDQPGSSSNSSARQQQPGADEVLHLDEDHALDVQQRVQSHTAAASGAASGKASKAPTAARTAEGTDGDHSDWDDSDDESSERQAPAATRRQALAAPAAAVGAPSSRSPVTAPRPEAAATPPPPAATAAAKAAPRPPSQQPAAAAPAAARGARARAPPMQAPAGAPAGAAAAAATQPAAAWLQEDFDD